MTRFPGDGVQLIVKGYGFIRGVTAFLLALTLVCAPADTGANGPTVFAALKPDGEWKAYATRTLAELPPAFSQQTDTALSRFGGWSSHPAKASGFFRTEKLDGRWWLVDPDGSLFIHKGVSSVRLTDTPGAVRALNEKFGGSDQWANQTTELLRAHGFNGLGAWSDVATLRRVEKPLVHTRLWSFMGAYGRKRGGTFQQPGHLGYPGDCIFVFDPGFEQFCDEYARQLAATKDDRWLLGHFSDNELPFPREPLKKYLELPAEDPGHQTALKWLRQHHGPTASATDVRPRDEADFLRVMVGRYFSIVSRAIKKYDPNHLYLGARFYGTDLRRPEIFNACGPHVDIVSVNYYRAWTPDPARLATWERESGRPVLITEWYAKGVDSGLPNFGGAGWLVRTQRERGMFYQNFTLALLESKVCVGWDWFKYMDNDPDDKKVDPSNRDSNKGVVNNRYVPYEPLLEAMKAINERTYALVEYFDRSQPRGSLTEPDQTRN